MPARSSTCTRAWEPRPDGALRGRLAGTSPSDRSPRTRSRTSGLRSDPGLLAAVDAAVLVLEWQTGGRFLVEQVNPAARQLLGGLAVAPPDPLPSALQEVWGKALAEAAGQGSAALPLFRTGPDCCLGGTARSLDATRVVATIRRPRALPKPRRSWTSSARWSAAGARTGRSTAATRSMPCSAACPGSR